VYGCCWAVTASAAARGSLHSTTQTEKRRGNPDWTSAVKEWYDESAKVDWSNLGFHAEAQQFTQMVWRDTKTLGCAVSAKCAHGPLYACFYGPSGNLIGVDWQRHVLPPATRMV